MSSDEMPTAGFAVLAAVGGILVALGVALALDYRGFTTWQGRTTTNMMWPLQRRLKRIPPWRWLPGWMAPSTPEDAVRNQVRIARIVGVGWAVMGSVAGLVGIFGLIYRIA